MHNLIGDKKFYKTLMQVAAPLVLQQLITTSVQLVDNVMVGRLGETSIGAVSIVNQLYFIVILVTFGVYAGGGIFTSQFFGSKNYEKLKETFRFKVILGFMVSFLAFVLFSVYGEFLIRLFTKNEETVSLGLTYLKVARWTAFPWVLSVSISNTFREIGITKPLLKISIVAILTNTILNFILIFGFLFISPLGVFGAAIATLIARIIEFSLMVRLLIKEGKIFNTRVKDLFVIDKKLLKQMAVMAIPLTLNELFWSSGQTAFLHSYSTRGDSALAAMNITNAISQLVFVLFGGIATAVAVLVGKELGSNKLEEARDNSRKLIAFAVFTAAVSGIMLFILSFFILNIYDVSIYTKNIAKFNIRINALFIPVYSFNSTLFYTLRSGGDTKSTLIMDSGYMWLVSVPTALVLAHFTTLEVTLMFLIVQCLDIPKAILGLIRYRKERWVQNLAVR